MNKQSLSQRYCYKINSDFIKRNKDNVKITNIREAIKNRLIVGIGDSTGTRMIRDIINSPYNEEYILDIKQQIKFKTKLLRKGEGSKTILKNEIKKLNEQLLVASLQDCLCNVVFKSDKDYDRYSKKGFTLNGNKYTLLLGTAGGIKLNTVLRSFIEVTIPLVILSILTPNLSKTLPTPFIAFCISFIWRIYKNITPIASSFCKSMLLINS